MKTSRAKSFRLHHMSRTGSLRKTSQSFIDPDDTFKLAALNSVTRGIKKADLSMITGDDLNKLRVEPLQPKEGQEIAAHCSLMDVRVRYDQMRKKSLQAENHILKQKEEIKKLETIKHQYEDKKNTGENKVTLLEQKLANIKSLLEETQTEAKVLQQMRARHKNDSVVYDQRKYDLEQWLEYQRKQLNIYRKQGITVAEGTDRTSKVYEKLQSEIMAQHHQREAHIRNLQTMIEEKLSLINANQQREAELGEIASRAIQDKGQDEKHWRMVYLTHVFVNKMLRFKIDIEMEKFKTVEQAFKTIKTATGVSDAKTLIHKYLSKETVYGQLLGKIADNERTINELKGEGDRLVHECKSLEDEREVLQSIKIKEQDLHDTIKQFDVQDDKSMKAYGLTRKIKQWIHRQLKKIYENGESEPEDLIQGMKSILEHLSKTVDVIEGDTLFKVEGDAGHHQKVVRVMPKRSRKNSAGEQIFDVDEQDINTGVTHEESEYINHQHDQLIHANQRFMKQLRKKVEEERKILLEKKETKAKNPKPVQVKKEEED